ncbi:MAG TPA: hypothetical protein PK954_11835, partial [Anaerolineales bacterium]|nr:hypothetical protein [Anaerolineales bacterium]
MNATFNDLPVCRRQTTRDESVGGVNDRIGQERAHHVTRSKSKDRVNYRGTHPRSAQANTSLGDILHDGAAWIDIDSDRMWRDIDEVPAGSNTDIAGSGLNNGLLTPVDPKDPDMLASILATKLYLPPLRPNAVRRPRLIERLSNGLLQGR